MKMVNQNVTQGIVGGPYFYKVGTDDIIEAAPDDENNLITVFADDNTPTVGYKKGQEDCISLVESIISELEATNLAVIIEKTTELRIIFKAGSSIPDYPGIQQFEEVEIPGFTISNNLLIPTFGKW